jgi:hypothetical protein
LNTGVQKLNMPPNYWRWLFYIKILSQCHNIAFVPSSWNSYI